MEALTRVLHNLLEKQSLRRCSRPGVPRQLRGKPGEWPELPVDPPC
ncbi:hypothetical protein BN2475_120106 [Paraburkholderia ribeironis]|uniref:Uncharacterized protein n=1 Tax=Paraburkholderia ribeironis TaxID=1247936 RepID=A0A1N7RR55_9BURK|nr:hypothetical protein BN2475_120106 [Paraburkholderia ribeironis]